MKFIGKHGLPVFVIGNPVEHTFSPKIHNSAFEAAGLPHRYFALEVLEGELGYFVDWLSELEAPGANVTLPHKRSICSAIETKTSEVQRLGAANTIFRRRGELRLANTDVYGFRRLVEPWLELAREEGVLVLGAGGAARACLLALEQEDCESVCLWNRTTEKAEALAREFSSLSPEVIGQSKLESGSFDAKLVVNATSVGLDEGDPSLVSHDAVSPGMVGVDLIYNRRTRFLETFDRAGCDSRGGLDMLVYQAAKSWELWTEQEAPVEAMFEAARANL